MYVSNSELAAMLYAKKHGGLSLETLLTSPGLLWTHDGNTTTARNLSYCGRPRTRGTGWIT